MRLRCVHGSQQRYGRESHGQPGEGDHQLARDGMEWNYQAGQRERTGKQNAWKFRGEHSQNRGDGYNADDDGDSTLEWPRIPVCIRSSVDQREQFCANRPGTQRDLLLIPFTLWGRVSQPESLSCGQI